MFPPSTPIPSRPALRWARHVCDRLGSFRGGPISSEATPGPVFLGWHTNVRIVASLDHLAQAAR